MADYKSFKDFLEKYKETGDRNVGSIADPAQYRELCDCESEGSYSAHLTKVVSTDKLTPECWSVQFFGLDYCKHCDLRNTDSCGGKDIIKTGHNSKGIIVPIGVKA
jgi:hypothetical protein